MYTHAHKTNKENKKNKKNKKNKRTDRHSYTKQIPPLTNPP